MNPTIQPEMHPDAESLTAFVDQALPAAGRERILAHMSTCRRCREVVFLAQQAAEEDQPLAAAAGVPIKPRTSWFSWRWAWIPAAACAGIIGVAVLQHSRREKTETQTAANVAPADALRTEGSQKAETQKPLTQNESKPAETAKPSRIIAEREIVPQTRRRDKAKKLEGKRAASQKDLVLGPLQLAPAPSVAIGSIHGIMAAGAKTAPIGGPSATNQFQQQSAVNQQSMLQQSQNVQLDAANKPVTAATLRAESETVTVQAEPVIPVQTPAASPATAQVSVIPTTEQSLTASPANVAGFKKKQKVSLPAGFKELSLANIADRALALDVQGKLFLSEDGGEHWKPVRTQWTGHAVLVRSLNTAEKGNATGALGAMKMSQTPRFELVTDDLKTWLSADGEIWTLQSTIGK